MKRYLDFSVRCEVLREEVERIMRRVTEASPDRRFACTWSPGPFTSRRY